MSKMIRKRWVLHGSVQGVGLRYRTKHGADSLGVTGWVQNEWDDTVTMEVQGTQEMLDQLLVIINRGTFVNITSIDSKELPVEEEERSFHIH